MGIALAVPISAYAQEPDFAAYESAVSDVVADEGGLASFPVDASGIEIDSEGEDALANGAPFDVAGFSRAQKGSNRAIDGAYRGYSYLQGDARNDVCLVAVDGYAVVYVDPAALEERAGSGDRDTSLSWVVAYLQKLDAEAASGSARLKPETPVYVTADESFDLEGEGLRFLFNQEYTSGAFYTSVIGIDGFGFRFVCRASLRGLFRFCRMGRGDVRRRIFCHG